MEVNEILHRIGFFFLEKEMEDKEYDSALNETYKFLRIINITDCKKLSDTKFEITLCRPGLLIGSKGSTITELQENLGVEITLKENTLAEKVYPLDISQY